MRIIRKKTAAIGLVTVGTVAVIGMGILNGLNVQSRAAFQKTAQSHATVQAGNLELTMSKLKDVNIAGITDAGNFDSDGITVDAPIGNTTSGGSVLSCTETFSDIYPGWKAAYGFEIKNTGSLNSYLDLYLGTQYVSPSDSRADWDEQDPRSRIKYTVYMANTLGGEFTDVVTGHLQSSTVIEGGNTEQVQYGNFQVPGKIPGTADELNSTQSTLYYIIVLEFEDNDEAFQGNNAGDNIYENSKFMVNFAVGTAGPLTTGFEFETETETESQPESESTTQETESESESQSESQPTQEPSGEEETTTTTTTD